MALLSRRFLFWPVLTLAFALTGCALVGTPRQESGGIVQRKGRLCLVDRPNGQLYFHVVGQPDVGRVGAPGETALEVDPAEIARLCNAAPSETGPLIVSNIDPTARWKTVCDLPEP